MSSTLHYFERMDSSSLYPTIHPEQWKEYQVLDGPKAREDYFNSVPHAFVNTLDAHVEIRTGLHLLINGPIVDTILGKILFHPNDVKGFCVNEPYLYSRTWTQMKQWNKINMKSC